MPPRARGRRAGDPTRCPTRPPAGRSAPRRAGDSPDPVAVVSADPSRRASKQVHIRLLRQCRPRALTGPQAPWQIPRMVTFNREGLAAVCRRHDVRILKIFGSAARGEDRPDSDVDFLVEFEGKKSLLDLAGLEIDLKEFLGRDVDVLTEPALSPYLRDRILASASVVYDREG